MSPPRQIAKTLGRHRLPQKASTGEPDPSFNHQRAGSEGQVSIPEQNATVKELAGPSQHLLPATSKVSSGSSSLNTSSS
jgi:hypothetical protein